MPANRPTFRRVFLAAAALFFGGCEDHTTAPVDYSIISLEGGTYFITQPTVSNANMEALFQGRVDTDQQGCLRLQGPDPATAIWPYGAVLDRRSSGAWVVDRKGNDIGKIGGTFRFGGGEVPFLHAGLGFQEHDLEEIHLRCPGRYWIVGDVLKP